MDTQFINAIMPAMAMNHNIRPQDIVKILKHVIVVDVTMKLIPKIISSLGKVRFHRRTLSLCTTEPRSASLELYRNYMSDQENDMFDALIWKLAETPQTKHLKRTSNGIYVINHDETIVLEQDILIRQLSITLDDKNAVASCSIEVFSHSYNLLKLKEYLLELERKFVIYKNNQLGADIFYFDEVPVSLPRTIDKTINYDMAPHNLTFTISRLQTNKSLSNVYGQAMKTVRNRVHFFMNNRKWYQDKGIPYTLGVLMYGAPGCGKTSLIKALSHDCHRHVFNLKLTEYTTVNQIQNLFFNDRVSIVKDGVTLTYSIPIDKRLIVIEDIDCLSSVVLQRPSEDVSSKQSSIQDFDVVGFDIEPMDISASYIPKPSKPTESPKEITHPQRLTLSVLLNVLDGVLETPGRIVIMTTNHPEKLDKALIRPGRIDLNVNFDKCEHQDIKEMIEKITERPCPPEMLLNIPNKHWTPAEVTQKIFENIHSTPSIVSALIPL